MPKTHITLNTITRTAPPIKLPISNEPSLYAPFWIKSAFSVRIRWDFFTSLSISWLSSLSFSGNVESKLEEPGWSPLKVSSEFEFSLLILFISIGLDVGITSSMFWVVEPSDGDSDVGIFERSRGISLEFLSVFSMFGTAMLFPNAPKMKFTCSVF